MKTVKLEELLVSLPITLHQVLARIDANGLGIVFVVDDERRLLGSTTDGDVRRDLLAGTGLNAEIASAPSLYNRTPKALPFSCRAAEVWSLLDTGIRVIPLLDEHARVVDFATRERVRHIPVLEPDIGEQELSNLTECARSGWISSQGPYIGQFERMFSEYLGGGHAVAVANGTVALQLGLTALGIGRGDEVIVPDFTFGASVNSIIHSGATPVLVDVDPDTWTLDLERTRAAIGPRTKAIMPVHVYGQPSRIDELRALADAHGLRVIEDCAEALGAEYKERRVGLDGDCNCFSFFANKLITTGEGGMIVFRDSALAAHAKVLRDHGMLPARRYWHEYPGFNFRMTNMQAAIGVAQMERIETFYARRRAVFDRYDALFATTDALGLLPRNDWSTNSCWLYTVVLNGIGEERRDLMIRRMSARGVDTRPGFYPMHAMPPFAKFSTGSFPVATSLAANSISLPSSPTLTVADQEHVAKVFLDELASCGCAMGLATG